LRLNPEQKKKLFDLIWLCKIGNFSEEESLTFINSGELGYQKHIQNEKKKSIKKPLTISLATYYRYKKIIESSEYLFKEIYKMARAEYISGIVNRWHLYQHLEAESIRALNSEKDPLKQQLIINGIFKNSVYITSLMDTIRYTVEEHNLPALDDAPSP